jgi:phage tail-like protein
MPERSLRLYRRRQVMTQFTVFNEAGQRVLSYHVHRCWPSEYVAVGDLDANNGAVAIETLVLQNEGWERDNAVTEPQET